LAACEVSLEICFFHLFTSRNLSSWGFNFTEVLFTATLSHACALNFRTAFNLFSVTVYML
jgi:hypothetical protein